VGTRAKREQIGSSLGLEPTNRLKAVLQTFLFTLMSKRFFLTLLSLLIIIPIGFYSKFYRGPASEWVNNSLGDVFYEIFWCLLIFLILSESRFWKSCYPLIIASGVFIFTCALEFLQLWHPPFLVFLRSYFIGATILGTTFVWSDFPYYLIGSIIGYFWIKVLYGIKNH